MFKEQAKRKTVVMTTYTYMRAFAWYIENPESAYLAKLLRLVLVRYEKDFSGKGGYAVNALWLCVCVARGRIRGLIENKTPWQRLTAAGRQEVSSLIGTGHRQLEIKETDPATGGSKTVVKQVALTLPAGVLRLLAEFSPSHSYPEHAALLVQLKKMETIISGTLKYWWKDDPERFAVMRDELAPCVEETVRENTMTPNKLWYRDVNAIAAKNTNVYSHWPLSSCFRDTYGSLMVCALGHRLLPRDQTLAANDFEPKEKLIINPRGEVVPHSRYVDGELTEEWYTDNVGGKPNIERDLLSEEAILLAEAQKKAAESRSPSRTEQAIAELKVYLRARQAARYAAVVSCANAGVVYLRYKSCEEPVSMPLPSKLFRGPLGTITKKYPDLFTPSPRQAGMYV